MADTTSTSPAPDDMHWGISYLREDLQDVKHDMRDFRKDVAGEFAAVRREMAQEFSNVRSELGDFRKEVALQLRHNLMITVGVTGVFSTIIIAFVIAFIEYRLPVG